MKKSLQRTQPRRVFKKPILGFLFIMLALLGCNKVTDQIPMNHGSNRDVGIGNILNEKGDLVYDWTDLQLRIILNANPTLPNGVVIRAFAYTGIALYESSQRGIPSYSSLSGILNEMPEMPQPEGNNYSWQVSANASLAAMTRAFYPAMTPAQAASVDSLENAYNGRLGKYISSDVFTRSQSFGRSVASAVTDWSKSDRFSQANAPYTVPVYPGAWEPTPPAFAPPATPYAGNMRPFLQAHAQGITGPPPFPFSDVVGSGFYNMVRDVYDVSFTRTQDQTNMALWWNDLGLYKGYTPPGHIMNVVNIVLRGEHKDLVTSILAYTKAGMALWDGLIVCWRSKYTFNQMRPVTYIRRFIDPNWLPLIPTPPHPEYPAAHAFITSAAMAAVASVIGDEHHITDNTYTFLGWPERTYNSLTDVGIEAGDSRRFGGIHYAPSIHTGHLAGTQVGEEIGAISFR